MFDFEFIREHWLYIATGIGDTLGVAISSFLLAVPVAVGVARGRRSTLLPIRALCITYVWLVDGIPLLLQIYFIFLALPQLRIFIPGLFGAGVFALTVNYGARISKIFYERFAAAGTSQDKPQRALITSLTNEFAGIIKDSTLISVTGFIHDVMWRANRVGRAEFKNFEALSVAAIIYLVLFIIVTLVGKALRSIRKTSNPGIEVSA